MLTLYFEVPATHEPPDAAEQLVSGYAFTLADAVLAPERRDAATTRATTAALKDVFMLYPYLRLVRHLH
ncbi:hypothetical protein CCE02nite_12020 [Cellulosimicrobium cellulans]|uniref:Uncharacterized protein n=1 Tax=Cellulosimicrobium cellulans TaxID=1710 RepID=A0A4Y4DWX1_CELCE|nr:hypothetical protein CCE02nite_12020 [Cellulosimicrobium cellulans]